MAVEGESGPDPAVCIAISPLRRADLAIKSPAVTFSRCESVSRRALPIVGQQRAAVTITPERLCRKEAGRGHRRQAADPFAGKASAERLRRVGQQEKALPLADGGQCRIVGLA